MNRIKVSKSSGGTIKAEFSYDGVKYRKDQTINSFLRERSVGETPQIIRGSILRIAKQSGQPQHRVETDTEIIYEEDL